MRMKLIEKKGKAKREPELEPSSELEPRTIMFRLVKW